MEHKCERCNRFCNDKLMKETVCPVRWLTNGVMVGEYLCPECYRHNNMKRVVCLLIATIPFIFIIGTSI